METDSVSGVKSQKGKVWIEGVSALGWGQGKGCTFAGALEAATSVTEHPLPYVDIMGVTGLAFRTRWFQGAEPGDRWCASNPTGGSADDIDSVSRATGWNLIQCPLDGEWDTARCTSEIIASIQAGKPVVGHVRDHNASVIYGYEREGKTFLAYDYLGGRQGLRVAPAEFQPTLIFLGERHEPLPPRDAALQGLRTAVRDWHRRHDPPDDDKRGYWYSEPAFAAWRRDIGLAVRLSEARCAKLFFVSWWTFASLKDARCAADAFVQHSLPLFEGDARRALTHSAGVYEREAEMLRGVLRAKDAFLGGWTHKSIENWSKEVRHREQQILAEASALEAAAIREIETVLAMGAGCS